MGCILWRLLLQIQPCATFGYINLLNYRIFVGIYFLFSARNSLVHDEISLVLQNTLRFLVQRLYSVVGICLFEFETIVIKLRIKTLVQFRYPLKYSSYFGHLLLLLFPVAEPGKSFRGACIFSTHFVIFLNFMYRLLS